MSKLKNLSIIMVALMQCSLTACGQKQEMTLVNEQSFSPAGAQSIRVDYDKDDITIHESTDGQITLKEYMDIDKSSYYANIENVNGELIINEGKRPGGDKLGCKVELYLPAGLAADVFIHATDSTVQTQIGTPLAEVHFETTQGNLALSDLEAVSLTVSSANGTVKLDKVTADTITLDTSNADVDMNGVSGAITYISTNGNLTMRESVGSGSFHASSDGTFDIAYSEITGSISVYTHNSKILFAAPSSAAFIFTATSKNGDIQTAYPDVTVNGGTASGSVGGNPQYIVDLETRNGDIEAK